ncbi:MAG: transposase [Anaerolineae bacterium]|nr:transposase [Anaerolineae bacterium]
MPDANLPESRTKRYSRWINNKRIDFETYYLPYAKALLESLASGPLVLIMDGSEVERRCMCLMVSVVYSLPIAWLVVKGNKRHLPKNLHVDLLKQVHALIPEDTQVIFLSDGEFDGTTLQATIEDYGWKYACRTAKNTILTAEEEAFAFEDVGVQPGEIISLPDVGFTHDNYGPVHAVSWWRKGYQEPIYLVSNMELAKEVCYWYKRRFHIETFFSDQKSRGFNLHKSHLSDPIRLARLLIAVCLAYLWIVFLGTLAMQTGLHKIIHRHDRCDISLFQMGLRTLEHFLNHGLPIPVAFHMLACPLVKSVR